MLDYLHTPAPSPEPRKELTSVPAPRARQCSRLADAAGAAVYRDHCAICHGDHLEGIAPSFPMLIGVGSRLSDGADYRSDPQRQGQHARPCPTCRERTSTRCCAILASATARTCGRSRGRQPAEDHYTFTGYRKFLDPDGYPAIAPPWGTLNAIDLKTGKYLWKIPLGEYPELAAKGMKNTGSENYGGPIVTAGGVLFIGATVHDRKFRAFDSRTGKLLWETELPFAGWPRRPPTWWMAGST